MKFSELQLVKKEVETEEINLDGVGLLVVKKTLPIIDKLEFIERVITVATEDIKNPIKLDMVFSSFLAIYYSNIEFDFTEANNISLVELYETLNNNGIIDAVYSLVSDKEINEVFQYCEQYMESLLKYNYSVLGLLESMQEKLLENKDFLANAQEWIKSNDSDLARGVIGLVDASEKGNAVK